MNIKAEKRTAEPEYVEPVIVPIKEGLEIFIASLFIVLPAN